jgi:hypothetical protein
VSNFTVLLPDIGKSSTCHTDRRKNKRKGIENAIVTVLADGLSELGPISATAKIVVFFYFIFFVSAQKNKRTLSH